MTPPGARRAGPAGGAARGFCGGCGARVLWGAATARPHVPRRAGLAGRRAQVPWRAAGRPSGACGPAAVAVPVPYGRGQRCRGRCPMAAGSGAPGGRWPMAAGSGAGVRCRAARGSSACVGRRPCGTRHAARGSAGIDGRTASRDGASFVGRTARGSGAGTGGRKVHRSGADVRRRAASGASGERRVVRTARGANGARTVTARRTPVTHRHAHPKVTKTYRAYRTPSFTRTPQVG